MRSSSSYLFCFTLPFIDVTLISPFTVLNKHSRARGGGNSAPSPIVFIVMVLRRGWWISAPKFPDSVCVCVCVCVCVPGCWRGEGGSVSERDREAQTQAKTQETDTDTSAGTDTQTQRDSQKHTHAGSRLKQADTKPGESNGGCDMDV